MSVNMEPLAWQPIWQIDQTDLAIGHPWFFATELSGDWKWLRFLATGESSCLGAAVRPCGVDGHAALPFAPDRLLVAGSPPGALIGRFGGSVAGGLDGTVFLIGSRRVVAMPDPGMAQLYLGINGAIADVDNRVTRLSVDLSALAD